MNQAAIGKTLTLLGNVVCYRAASASSSPICRSRCQAITPIALPVGDWSVNANGSHGVLHISGIDAAGNIQAGSTIYGNTIVGFYDSTSGRISFIRVMESSPTFEQIYNGYLFRDIPTPTLSYLAGSFAAYQGGGGVALRIDYGWYASKLAIVILK